MKKSLALLSMAGCLLATSSEAATHITRPHGDWHHTQYKIYPIDGEVIDLSGARFFGLEDGDEPPLLPLGQLYPPRAVIASLYQEASNGSKYPVSLKGNASGFAVRGGTIIGTKSPLYPWAIFKQLYDSDGLRVEGRNFQVVGPIIRNMVDGFSPQGGGPFLLSSACIQQIHDDAVENDSGVPGNIINCFLGGHTIYSDRGDNTPNNFVSIINCVCELELHPHQGDHDPTDINTRGGYPYPDGLGNGTLLKLDGLRSGRGRMLSCVVLWPRHSTSSMKAMKFPENWTFSNVTICWLGHGDFPWPAPKGVTITRDRTAFDLAKARLFSQHPDWLQ